VFLERQLNLALPESFRSFWIFLADRKPLFLGERESGGVLRAVAGISFYCWFYLFSRKFGFE
jgi:hypothetical protein